MKKIKCLEIAEITSNIEVKDLVKLNKEYLDLNLSYGVELYGSKENGNVEEKDDKPSIATLQELNHVKSLRWNGANFKTAAHLNFGYVDAAFSGKRDFNKCKVWEQIGNNTDKVVYNLNTLSKQQREDFSANVFFRLLKTKANPLSPEFTNSQYYMVVGSEVTSEFLYDKLDNKFFEPHPYDGYPIYDYKNIRYAKNIKALSYEADWGKWPVAKGDGDYVTSEVLKYFEPAAWCGFISPDNVEQALNMLDWKLGGDIERIDICTRGGVMTDGKVCMDKVEAFMKNADYWQRNR